MNRKKWALVLFLIKGALVTAVAQDTESYEVVRKSLRIVNSDGIRLCRLDVEAIYAIPSYDRSAIIVSDRGYVRKVDVDNCSSRGSVPVHLIPDRVGFLSDINLSKKIYVALDFVDVRPFRYLATVAKIGSTKNIVELDGAYLPGASLAKLKKHAFSANGEAGASLISRDGRYVAADGVISCSVDSFPGVWDILKNEKIIRDDSSCSALLGE